MRSVVCGYCEKTIGYEDRDVHIFRFEVRNPKRFCVIHRKMRVITCPFCDNYVEVEDEKKKSNKK